VAAAISATEAGPTGLPRVCAAAFLRLGLNGVGRPKDEQGYALGLTYHEGLGVPSDCLQAIPWFRKAAAQGWGLAEIDLVRLGHGRRAE